MNMYVFSVAQICNLLVSPEITARRDDFFGARTALSACSSVVSSDWRTRLSALLWLRFCRAALYRRIAFCGTSASVSALESSDALPIANRRYGRLQICATGPRCALYIYEHVHDHLAASSRTASVSATLRS